jgi:membrane fusion protein (multidrug efflux system)
MMAEDTTRPSKRGNGRHWGGALGLAALAALALGLLAWRYASGRESTDDAQIDGHINAVATRIKGTVRSVNVEDNQRVEAGALLVEIDPRDYEVALERARADLAEAEAVAEGAKTGVPMTSTMTGGQLQAAQSDLATARARLASSEALRREASSKDAKAAQDLERTKRLHDKDEVSQQEYDTTAVAADAARATREAAEAGVREAEAGVAAAEAHLAQAGTGPQQVAIVRSRAVSAAARVEQARAALHQAELDLEHASITAPVAGVVSKRSVEVGQVVQEGQPLMALVPLEDVWVTANFKENQLHHIRSGQPVTVAVDAYGRHTYRGRVDSIAAATGAKFSLLPPENATGNYVKVVQRIPVKILLEKGQDPEHLLRPGMSVVSTIHTR